MSDNEKEVLLPGRTRTNNGIVFEEYGFQAGQIHFIGFSLPNDCPDSKVKEKFEEVTKFSKELRNGDEAWIWTGKIQLFSYYDLGSKKMRTFHRFEFQLVTKGIH